MLKGISDQLINNLMRDEINSRKFSSYTSRYVNRYFQNNDCTEVHYF